MRKLIPYVYLILSFGCELQKEQESQYQSVMSITTTYISHQSDTKHKDQNTIAKVWFHPDGTVREFTQYMTYPYEFPDPKPVEFWNDSVNKATVPLIMDGLELGLAERNFLYGNDWPKDYVAIVNEKGHRNFPKDIEGFTHQNFVEYEGNDLPVTLKIELTELTDSPFIGMVEGFTYDRRKVTSMNEEAILNESSPIIKEIQDKKIKGGPFGKSETRFEYEGDKLTAVLGEDDRTHRFYYLEGLLIKSEFYIHDKLYNYRIYTYDSNGRKEKTEMYNVDNDLEYSILYVYEFF
jgi:hypothetical protein